MISQQMSLIAARLSALEYMVTSLHASLFLRESDPMAAFRQTETGLLALIDEATLPDVDPALSDHATDEVGQALRTILNDIREMIEENIRRD